MEGELTEESEVEGEPLSVAHEKGCNVTVVCPHGEVFSVPAGSESCRRWSRSGRPPWSSCWDGAHSWVPPWWSRPYTSQYSVVSWKTVIFRYLHVWYVVNKAKSRGSQSLVFELWSIPIKHLFFVYVTFYWLSYFVLLKFVFQVVFRNT